MGAKQSILENIEFSEPISINGEGYFTRNWSSIIPGRFHDRHNVTVFGRDFLEDEDALKLRKIYENGGKHLKKLRHPAILKFYASSVSKHDAFLVTESVQPLEIAIEELEPIEILAGLGSIFDALIFLHEQAEISHNNLSPDAIFVDVEGGWKLGNFECASVFDVSGRFLNEISEEISEFFYEEFQIPTEIVAKPTPQQKDWFAFGKILEKFLPKLEKNEIFDVEKFFSFAEFLKTGNGNFSDLKNEKIFKNDLTEILEFLQNLPLKSAEEKENFFKNLMEKLKKFSPKIIARRLAKLLLSRFVLLEKIAVDFVLAELLIPLDPEASNEEKNVEKGLIPVELFRKFFVPELAKIFLVHETSVRLALCKLFPHYCSMFSEKTLKRMILPELLTGMKDTNDEIVAASFHCLAHLVPLLGAEKVTGLQHKRYFTEGMPRKNLPNNHQIFTTDAESDEILVIPRENGNIKINIENKRLNVEEEKDQDYYDDDEEKISDAGNSRNSPIFLRPVTEKKNEFERKEKRKAEIAAKREQKKSASTAMKLGSIKKPANPDPDVVAKISGTPKLPVSEISGPEIPQEFPEKIPEDSEDPEDWSVDWEQKNSDPKFVPNLEEFRPPAEIFPPPKNLPKNFDGLGTEFEIQATFIRRSAEDDLFADLAPKFSAKEKKSDSKETEIKETQKNRFGVENSADFENSDGWGAEGENW